jgi:hypothetical protein
MNREAKQELRRVLMGRTEPAPDGRLTAMEKGKLRVPLGISDGATAVRFLGIFKKACRLKLSCPEDKARSLAAAVMRDCGRELILPQQPKAVACLIRYVFSRPAVLIFDFQDGIPVLTAWTGRGLTGLISVRRALKAFLKRMPKQFELSDKEAPKDRDEALENQKKQEKKQKKKEQKNKKKAPENSAEAAVPEETPNTAEEQANEPET